MAHSLKDIRTIQARGTHAYAHSIRCRFRRRLHFANLKSFNATVGSNDYCFHAVDGKW